MSDSTDYLKPVTMSTKTKAKTKKAKPPANFVWFEIPADDPQRARKFYNSLFGWKIKAFPDMSDYWHIDTSGPDASPDGGLMKRKCPEHKGIMNYVLVDSVDKAAARVQKLGGQICKEKTEVPGMGWFVICLDPEGNGFALWEPAMKG